MIKQVEGWGCTGVPCTTLYIGINYLGVQLYYQTGRMHDKTCRRGGGEYTVGPCTIYFI